MRRRILCSMVAVTVLLAGCRDAFSAHKSPDTIETARFDPALKVDLKSSTKRPSGVYYRDLVVGTGPEATKGMEVTVGYVLWTTDGQQLEASPVNDPYIFRLGTKAVIAGWDDGVAGMRVGGRRQLIVPPELGYGAAGAGTKIAPNTILVFMVELTDAKQE